MDSIEVAMQVYSKKSKTKNLVTKSKSASIVCEKCKYERKESDLSPSWQCPCCEMAYAKVSKEYIQRSATKKSSRQLRKNREKKDLKHKANAVTTSIGALKLGALLIKGTTCAGALMSSPILVKIIGASLILGSVMYLVSKFSG